MRMLGRLQKVLRWDEQGIVINSGGRNKKVFGAAFLYKKSGGRTREKDVFSIWFLNSGFLELFRLEIRVGLLKKIFLRTMSAILLYRNSLFPKR